MQCVIPFEPRELFLSCSVLTGVLEVHVIAIESILQTVRHDLQLHYLLSYCHVRLGDVNFHFRVVYLACEAIANHLWKVPGIYGKGFNEEVLLYYIQG